MIYKTEYEAWQVVWDVLVGCGMPEKDYYICAGLCDVVACMALDGAISRSMYKKMIDRIIAETRHLNSLWLAPCDKPAPRIPYVEKFMEECKR